MTSERARDALAMAAAYGERHGWKAAWISLSLVTYLIAERVF